jgi:hypothetical protein
MIVRGTGEAWIVKWFIALNLGFIGYIGFISSALSARKKSYI